MWFLPERIPDTQSGRLPRVVRFPSDEPRARVTHAVMKLFRFGPVDQERPGVVDGSGNGRDASAFTRDFDHDFFRDDGLSRLAGALATSGSSWPEVDLASVRLGPPIARPSKLIGIGLNYRDHAAETGAAVPTDPKIFMKATSAICGVFDDVQLPEGATQLDHEVELAVVIGKRAKWVSENDSLSFVAGYTMCNDYSERDWQKNRSGQFVKGKSSDSFAPLGPFLVTADEGDFADVRLWCSINDEMRQDSRTSEMVFNVRQLIASLSQYMTLLPGDVIATGTPAGVGLGRKPPVFLRLGDRVRYGIEGIGDAEQIVTKATW